MVAAHIVQFDSVVVHVVENGHAVLGPLAVRLRAAEPLRRPGVEAAGDELLHAALPAHSPLVLAQAAPGPQGSHSLEWQRFTTALLA